MTGPARKKKTAAPRLAPKQADYLAKRSVDEACAKQRGYRTVTSTDRAFLRAQGLGAAPTPGLLIPIWWDNEVVQHQVRSDVPREDEETGKEIKFENPYGRPNRLDCHPSMAADLADGTARLWITEGVVKADALVSWLEEPVIAITGVDNWRGSIDERATGPLPEWDDVPLDGRLVVVAFDADAAWSDGPLGARQRLTAFLHGRGAQVRWLYLPQKMRGATGKVGVDDYLAHADDAGESIERLIGAPRFKINAKSGSLPDRTALALTALDVWNDPPSLFRRGRALVEVNAQSLEMEDVEEDRFRNRMARAAEWITTTYKDGKKVVEKKVAPPTEVVRDARVQYEDHRFPQLARVVTTPVFAGRPHWSLRTEPGYDAATGNLYIPPKGLEVPPVPEQPTKRQAHDAMERLLDYIAEFPFLTDADKAHAVALMLQPFARGLMRDAVTPLYVAEAPTEGTGKGLLLETLLVPGVGSVEGLGPKTDEKEIDKNITTLFLESRPVIFFDNWPTGKKFASASVASALTMKQYTSRILGVSKSVNAPNNVVWLLSANNPTFSPEIRRRVVRIRLDAGVEDPKGRTFNKTLPGDALANRGQMIHDACTVIAYWLSIGRPGPEGDVPPIGSFSAWRYVMGGILAAVGVSDFLGSLRASDSDADDPEKALATDVFRILRERHGADQPFTAKQVESLLDTEDLTTQLVPSHTRDDYRTTALGHWFNAHRDRVYDGHQLRQIKRTNKGMVWMLIERPQKAQP